jgi:NTE family protein
MMKNTRIKKGLVLGGGGARGIYQIGVWKALKNLHVEFEAFAGTSVGALNCVLAAQGNYRRAEDLWLNIGINNIVELPDELVNQGRIHLNKQTFPGLKKLNDMLWKHKGLNTEPLMKVIQKYCDEKWLRAHSIQFGLVSIDRKNMKPLEVFLEDIPPGKLANYLIASSALPGFKKTEINGHPMSDGGMWDNLPSRLLYQRGYRNLVLVDVAGPGVTPRPHIEGTDTLYVKISKDIGGLLDFHPSSMEKLLKLGELDTYRASGACWGLKYCYTRNDRIGENLLKILDQEDIRSWLVQQVTDDKKALDNLSLALDLLPKQYKHWHNPVYALAECAATLLKVDEYQEYSFKTFLKAIGDAVRDFHPGEESEISTTVRKIPFMRKIVQGSWELVFRHFSETLLQKEQKKSIERYLPHFLPGLLFLELYKRYSD